MGSTMNADNLHRLVKQVMDSGQASTVEEAKAIFLGYRIVVGIGDSKNPSAQTGMLTAVALARRVFLGGVFVTGDLDVPMLSPLFDVPTLREAVQRLGAETQNGDANLPTIWIGGPTREETVGFSVRATFSGWRGGVVPACSATQLNEQNAIPLAAMLAAALAINEAYLFVSGASSSAGRRRQGLSLWYPSAEYNWLETWSDGPTLEYLPSKLWLIGLGHLGQAYLWALGSLPYAKNKSLSLVLQDFDEITVSSESTSVLTDVSLVGTKKTRALAKWADSRGFRTTIHERLFDGSFSRQPHEPPIALCGLDNALGRQHLDQVGFDFVVEAGLGRNYQNFQTLRLHTLPATRSGADIWRYQSEVESPEPQGAYRALLESGQLDHCGVTMLAGKAVGAPFVGSVAACLAVSEILRLLHGGVINQMIDLDLRSVEHRVAVTQAHDFGALNPGYLRVTAHDGGTGGRVRS
jgi:hypothetical protein